MKNEDLKQSYKEENRRISNSPQTDQIFQTSVPPHTYCYAEVATPWATVVLDHV